MDTAAAASREPSSREQLRNAYLDTLRTPSAEECRRISEVQLRNEAEIDDKYHRDHSHEEHQAARTIQAAYRGHRERRQLHGLSLDPSSRWVEAIKEWRYRSATAPRDGTPTARRASGNRPRTVSEAKLNWQRAGLIAERAGEGGSPGSPRSSRDGFAWEDAGESSEAAISLLLDQRYFLEMVDQKHRYGANLQVYHEEWLRSRGDQNFFHWLDQGDGRYLDLPGCARAKLDKECIRYLGKDERRDYLVHIDDDGKLRWAKTDELITTSVECYRDSMHGIVPHESCDAPPDFNDEEVKRKLSRDRRFAREMAEIEYGPGHLCDSSDEASSGSRSPGADVLGAGSPRAATPTKSRGKTARKHFHVSPATILNHLLRATVKPGTWIYVADTVGRLYVGIKSSGAFQHTSFLSGARISSAGLIGISDGVLTYLSPLSGHYRPTTTSFRAFITSLQTQGADLSSLKVSHAYEVLLSMEYYGRTKKGVHKVVKPNKASRDDQDRPTSPNFDEKMYRAMDTISATEAIEQNWEKEHRRGLARLMDDLRIGRRRSREE